VFGAVFKKRSNEAEDANNSHHIYPEPVRFEEVAEHMYGNYWREE
jgi:hypothetical protein